MTRFFHLVAAATATAGAVAVAWVAAGYLPGHPLALAVTLLIAGCYAGGLRELWRFHQASLGLQRALAVLGEGQAPPSTLAEWLAQVPAALRPAVRLRVQDERGGLPGLALTPYLAGLLVLLGMLGTFLGMVVTLQGTGLALQSATDVQALRDSLAAPVRGLGLAFGTSVAGVAASAALGLLSALARRHRAGVAQALEAAVGSTLQTQTRSHQQREAQAQQQAQVVAQLTAQLTAQFLAHQQAQADQQARQAELQARQAELQAQQLPALLASVQAMATQVGQSLQQHLAEGARHASDSLATLQPAVQATVEGTMAGITRETAALHGHVASTVQQQLEGLAQRFEQQAQGWLASSGAQTQALTQAHTQALLQALETSVARQQAQTQALLQHLDTTLAQQQARQAADEQARLAAFSTAMAQMAEHTRAQFAATGLQLQAETQAQARRTIEEMARLAASAGEAPRAAAEVVTQLRSQLSASLAQDTALLAERQQLLDTLHTLLGTVQHTATAQKAAVDELVASSARWLQEAGTRFTEKADAETARLEQMAALLSASAVDVASLGEAFGGAVAQFDTSSQQLLARLQHLDEALAQAGARSDEQLAYTVAQARELIDLSLLSQKQITDELQHLAQRLPQAPALADAA